MQTDAQPSFTYAYAWCENAAFRSLSLFLPAVRRNPVLSGAAVTHDCDHLLPYSDAIRRRLHARFSASDTGAFALLAAMGRDCAGAVQRLPPDETPHDIDRIDAVRSDDAAVERLLRHVTDAPKGLLPYDGDDLRLSIAGAQEKPPCGGAGDAGAGRSAPHR